MKVYKHTYLALIFISLISGNIYSQDFQFNMAEVLTIGEKNSEELGYLFSSVQLIQTGPDDQIYVADHRDDAIRIFDEDGIFIKTVGRRGRGPGEFSEVTFFSVNEEGNITALDRMQMRVTFFDKNGGLVKTESLAQFKNINSSFVYPINNGKQLLVGNRDYVNPIENRDLIHLFDSTFSNSGGSFLDVFSFFYDDQKDIQVRMSATPFYETSLVSDKYLAISPRIYTGNISLTNLNTLETKSVGDKLPKILTQYDFDKREEYRRKGIALSSLSGQGYRYLYQPTGQTLGLAGNDNFIIQYYFLRKEEETQLFLRVYSSAGKLLQNISLENQDHQFIRNDRFTSVLRHMDNENNLYFSDYLYNNSHAAVVVFKTNLDQLLESKE